MFFWILYVKCNYGPYQQAQDLEDDGGPEAAEVRVTRECAQEGAHERGARHICDRIRGVSARLPPNLDQIDDQIGNNAKEGRVEQSKCNWKPKKQTKTHMNKQTKNEWCFYQISHSLLLLVV